MAWTLIGHRVGQQASVPFNTTGADLLVAIIVDDHASIGSISDTYTNSWSVAATSTDAVNPPDARIWYALNPIVGAAHDVTAAHSYSAAALWAWSGVATAPTIQTNTNPVNTVTSNTTGSVTPSAANALLIGATGLYAGGTGTSNPSVDSGLTMSADDILNESASHYGLYSGYLVQGSAAAVNPQFSWTTSANARGIIAAFQGLTTTIKLRKQRARPAPFSPGLAR